LGGKAAKRIDGGQPVLVRELEQHLELGEASTRPPFGSAAKAAS
jgi:hypothetical protein